MIDKDLKAFFSTTEFAEFVHFGVYDILAIFDQEYHALSPFGGEISSTDPSLLMMDTDVASYGVETGNILTIRGKEFYVTSTEPDGTGITRLHLSKDYING